MAIRVRGKYGRRAPSNKPALELGPLLTGVVPAHPKSVDYLLGSGPYAMGGNDTHGDCVAVTLGNIRQIITKTIGTNSVPYTQNTRDNLKFYATQNPAGQDNGMDEQTALETLHKDGAKYYDGVAPLAFAKVDVTNELELDAATAIFGPCLLGIDVTTANETEFDAGKPWDYVSRSQVVGGHAVVEGGYDESRKTGLFETWQEVTTYTDTFRQHQLQEFWAIVWPEHLGSKAFLEGVDQAALAAAYTALTGRPFPVTPTPTPTPQPTPPPPTVDPDATLNTAFKAWQHAKGLS